MEGPPIKLPSAFTNASELELGSMVKILLYGETGTGKTTILCTAPNPVIVLTEKKSARRIKAMSRSLKLEIPTYLVETPNDMEKLIATMRRVPEQCEKKGVPFVPFTVCIDSITDYYQILINALTVGRKSVLPQKNDWQIIQNDIEKTLRDLSGLPHHLIVVGGQKEFKVTDEDGDEWSRIVPAFSGDKLPFHIGKLFQAVGHTVKRSYKGKTRWLVEFESDRAVSKIDDGLRPLEVPNASLWFKSIEHAFEVGDHSYTSDYDLEVEGESGSDNNNDSKES